MRCGPARLAALGRHGPSARTCQAGMITTRTGNLRLIQVFWFERLNFDELVDVGADFAGEYAGVVGFDAHKDALGVHLVHDAVAAADGDPRRNRAR